MTYGNRFCIHEGCTTNGGSLYMDGHEALPHGRCVCGWYGATRNITWHRSQRVRYSARPDAERHLHYLIAIQGGDHMTARDKATEAIAEALTGIDALPINRPYLARVLLAHLSSEVLVDLLVERGVLEPVTLPHGNHTISVYQRKDR